MGQSMKLGTGALQVVRPLGLGEKDLKQQRTMFEDGWDAL
jgi:DNA-directed RNA polymerase III subunit RPC1